MENQDMLANFMAEMKVSNESLRADMLTNNNTIINNMNKSNEAINDKFESLQAINAATREELLQKIDMRYRASSRAISSKHLTLRHAVTPTATFPVATVPIIVTVLETPPVCLTVSDIECCSTPMEPILSMTNIIAIESPQPLESMIEVPVRTTTPLYDITPPFKSNHASEAIPMDDNPNMDADGRNHKVLVSFNDFNDQYTNSTPQVEYPHPIIIEDNSSDNKYGCFSGDCDATSYSDSGTVHTPMAMVLIY
jgi:hypothetical protein